MTDEVDTGSAGVLAVWVVALVVCVLSAALTVGSAVVARHRAARTADLSALAAAGVAARGGDGCAAAQLLTADAGGTLVGCELLPDGSVQVLVALPTGPAMPPARARARAGGLVGVTPSGQTP